MCGDQGCLFHKGPNVAKKMEAWSQKEISSSQYHGYTVAYTAKNVYKKSKGNEIDAMPLCQSSGGSQRGLHPQDWIILKIHRIQEE